MKNSRKVAALMLAGLFAFGVIGVTEAADKEAADVKIEQKTKVGDKVDEKSVKDKNDREIEKSESGFMDRIQAILHPENVNKGDTNGNKVSVNYEPDDIFGTAQATEKQCVRFLLASNPYPSINCTAEEIVHYYYEEAGKEGIRPDVAFVQALKETGFFGYGGTVVPEQNNYCGLGTTSATVQGGYFESPRIGVRAHIQHLMAYASVQKPKEVIVDPRYDLVRDMYGENVLVKWTDLNGRWAVPGTYYGQSILEMFEQLLQEPKE